MTKEWIRTDYMYGSPDGYYDIVEVPLGVYNRLCEAANEPRVKQRAGTKADLSSQIDKLETENRQHKSEIANAEKRLAECKTRCEKLTADAAEAVSAVKVLSADLERVKAELAAARAELSKYACPREGVSRFALLEVE